MNDIAIILASEAAGDKRIFKHYLDIDYDILYLCSDNKPKILKKDVDLDFKELEKYKLICPVGAEPLKYVCGKTGITKYNGILVENRYMPIIHPNLVEFRPQYKEDIIKACKKIEQLTDSSVKLQSPSEYKSHKHITDVDEFEKYFVEHMLPASHVVTDIETTALSPYKGHIIGVAFSTKAHEGVFVDSHIVKKYKERIQKEVFDKKVIIFHNAKFDMWWLNKESWIKGFSLKIYRFRRL